MTLENIQLLNQYCLDIRKTTKKAEVLDRTGKPETDAFNKLCVSTCPALLYSPDVQASLPAAQSFIKDSTHVINCTIIYFRIIEACIKLRLCLISGCLLSTLTQ